MLRICPPAAAMRWQNLGKEAGLDLALAVLGIEEQGFVFFEFGRDVALGIDQGLLAHVGLWYSVQVGFGHFDIVAKDLVVSYLEILDPRVSAFLAFQVGDPLFGIAHGDQQVVQLGRKAGTDGVAAGDGDRGVIDDRFGDERGGAAARIEAGGQGVDRRRQVARRVQRCAQGGNGVQCLADADQVARAGNALADPPDQALQVGQTLEPGADLGTEGCAFDKGLYDV